MKKILCLVIAIMLMMTCVGCTSVDEVENSSDTSMFVRAERCTIDGYYFNVLYHKETRVMYTVSYEGMVTVMLDADGKPLLWED